MVDTTVLADGLYFGEDPRWRGDRLFFSDFYAHTVGTVTMGGEFDVVVEVPGQPSGLGWLPGGDLLVVSMTDRRVLRWNGSKLTEHADLGHIATFHCNDMLVAPDGRAYVGNFGFDLDASLEERGIEATLADPTPASLALVLPDGSAEPVATDLVFPNGMALTPDGATLVVAETLALRLTAFDVGPGGGLTNRRVWADLSGSLIPPDGISMDADGQIWVANALAPQACRIAKGGAVTATVATTQNCYAVELGGPQGDTLFCMTAPTSAADELRTVPQGRIETAVIR